MKSAHIALGAILLASIPVALSGQAPSQLRSGSKLQEDPGKGDSWTYRNPRANFAKYTKFIIEPTAVYSDPSASWSSASPADRQKYANEMTKALRKEIGEAYQIVDRPGPGVARMRLTLMGIDGTVTVAATASKVTPMGLALNGVKSLAGKKGSFMGSVQAAFELTDAQSGELQFAAVRRRSPNALDIEASLSTEKTVEAVADDIASAVRKALDKASGRQN